MRTSTSSGRLATANDIGPNVVHALYLVNLASADSALQGRSIDSLIDQMRWTEALGALGLIVHVGSRVGRGSVEDALNRAVEGIDEGCSTRIRPSSS
jgi:endonuclease IV